MTTAPTEDKKKKCEDDSSDSDDGDQNKRHQRNLDEDAKQLNTIFEIDDKDDFKSDEEDKIQMSDEIATENTVGFRSSGK